MPKAKLSQRFAHGERDTFFVGVSDIVALTIGQKNAVPLLNFRHTQYAPLGAINLLKNNGFILNVKISCSVQLLRQRTLAHIKPEILTLPRTLQEPSCL
jgi:hypothetical protein